MMNPLIESPAGQGEAPYKEIWLAGGCFWGTQAYLAELPGVLATAAGYANGNTPKPSYEQVCTGTTGFAEAVYVAYDPVTIRLSFLLSTYYKSVNPLSLNRQGGDIGTQYRTGIYYTDPVDQEPIAQSIQQLEQALGKPVTIEQRVLDCFYLAEEYHQDYLKKTPGGYCHIPQELFDYAKTAKEYTRKSKEVLQKELTPVQYHVTQEDGTEKPFANEYDQEFRKGIYVDNTTGEPLFLSTHKFDAGCGWPAFSRPITSALLLERPDTSRERLRTEVRSATGDSHLGHVFEDGPEELGGLRYCINSASLRFIPVESMKQEGYEEYISLVK